MTKKIQMGGICGMGMAPLASFLIHDSCTVYGFDDCPNNDVAQWLTSEGVIWTDNCDKNFDELIISTALASRQNELRKKYPDAKIMRRGEAWARLCNVRRLCAVVGSHGKSTVSALMAHASIKLNIDCGYLVGAFPNGFNMSSYVAENGVVISEIDESDGTIELFTPEVLLALNADLDHQNTYADESKLCEMFERLFERTTRKIIYPKNDKILNQIAKKFGDKCLAIDTPNDFNLSNKILASNAIKQMFEIDCPLEVFDDYKGLQRRQEILKDNSKIFAISDYAHHPTEVEAFIKYFEQISKTPRAIFFQPHRYTRTKSFADKFAKILSDASSRGNKVYLLPVYPASEPFDVLGESSAITKLCPENSIKEIYVPEIFLEIEKLKTEFSEKKLAVAFVGAGDFYFPTKNFMKEYE